MPTHRTEVSAFFDDLALTYDTSLLTRGLKQFGQEAVRRELLRRLESGDMEGFPIFLFAHVLKASGMDELSPALLDYIHDQRRPRFLRALLAYELADHDTELWRTEIKKLPPEDFSLHVEGYLEGVFHVLRLGYSAPDIKDGREDLVETLEALPKSVAKAMSAQLEPLRIRASVPASKVWPSLLLRPKLSAVHPILLDALVSEGTDEAIAALDELRHVEGDEALRKRAQHAYLRARSRSIDPDVLRPSLAPAVGRISQCQGDGSFIADIRINRGDGFFDGITFVFEEFAEKVRGGVIVRQLPAFFDRQFDSITRSGVERFVTIPVADLARLLKQFVSRDKLGKQLQTAWDLVEPYADESPELADIAPAPDATPEDYERLLAEHPAYMNWDLGGQIRALSAFIPQLSEQGETMFFISVLLSRLRLVFAVNTLWHQCNGEAREAAIAKRAVSDIARDDFNGPFPALVVEWFEEAAA